MKIGRDPGADFDRVRAARKAIGPDVHLFVDANGAYSRKQALAQAEKFAELDVRWFEEPVSSDDLEGLRLLRDRAPAGMKIAAGEYGYDSNYFNVCSPPGPSMYCRRTPPDALESPAFSRRPHLCRTAQLPFSFHCARRASCHSGLRCSVVSGSGNISSIMRESSRCFSTALLNQ
jgi:hypothetical protein